MRHARESHPIGDRKSIPLKRFLPVESLKSFIDLISLIETLRGKNIVREIQ